MAVKVSFMRPGGLGSVNVVGVGKVRICETIAVGGTTTASSGQHEFAWISSTEATAVNCAYGTTPDATAAAETTLTSAAFAIQPNETIQVATKVGDKISIATFA